jgi:group I intron endonuclease
MDLSCENDILEDDEKVYGLIYLIKCKDSILQYVGQTVSHRKNKGKYRPFGIQGRFKDHISEAVCNTKRKQCSFLNNAIRKYGPEAFSVEQLEVCLVTDLNARESHYIALMNTLAPNGYNLTKGGKTTYSESYLDSNALATPQKRGGCKFRSEETRRKMSKRSKEVTDDALCKKRAAAATAQHYEAKFERFKGCTIDMSRVDEYIRTKGHIIVVQIGEATTRFAGKHDTKDQKLEKARAFIKLLNDATLSNCGKPVKPE